MSGFDRAVLGFLLVFTAIMVSMNNVALQPISRAFDEATCAVETNK